MIGYRVSEVKKVEEIDYKLKRRDLERITGNLIIRQISPGYGMPSCIVKKITITRARATEVHLLRDVRVDVDLDMFGPFMLKRGRRNYMQCCVCQTDKTYTTS